MMRALQPLALAWEQVILSWARRELHPLHPAMPTIVHRLRDRERAPSPLDPADSIVTGACILAALALLAFTLVGWVQ